MVGFGINQVLKTLNMFTGRVGADPLWFPSARAQCDMGYTELVDLYPNIWFLVAVVLKNDVFSPSFSLLGAWM